MADAKSSVYTLSHTDGRKIDLTSEKIGLLLKAGIQLTTENVDKLVDNTTAFDEQIAALRKPKAMLQETPKVSLQEVTDSLLLKPTPFDEVRGDRPQVAGGLAIDSLPHTPGEEYVRKLVAVPIEDFKPKVRVRFSGAFGAIETRFHEIIRKPDFVVLLRDTRYDGDKYSPPLRNFSDAAGSEGLPIMSMTFLDSGDVISILPVGLEFSIESRHLEAIILLTTAEREDDAP